MSKIVQLYYDNKNTIKAYPRTTTSCVFDESGKSVKEQLETIEQQVEDKTKPLSNSKKLKGCNLVVLENGEPESTRKSAIEKAKLCGMDTIVIAIPVYMSNGIEPNFYNEEMFEQFKRLVIHSKLVGFENIFTKFHTLNPPPSSDIDKWFKKYEELCGRLLEFSNQQGIKKIFLHNELHNMTTPNTRSYWEGIISRFRKTYPLHSYGFSVSDYPQADNFTMYDLYDWAGITFYPRMTQKGLNETDKNLIKSLYYDLSNHNSIGNLNKIKHRIKKPIYVSEVGCCARGNSLTSPAGVDNNSPRDWQVPNKFYDIVLPVLLSTSCVDGLFTFSINVGDFAIFNGTTTEPGRTISKHFGGTL